MPPSKRQIIKVRSQRPYIVARVVLIILVLAAILAGLLLLAHPHPAHGAMLPALISVRQEAPVAARTAPIRT